MMDWDSLVRMHGSMVFGTVWRILGNEADAEDVFQEVFLEAYRNRVSVRHWPGLLRRLATYRALDRLRQRKEIPGLDGDCLPSRDGDPEASAIEHELAERLRQAVAQLPEREAAVFCLRFFDELSYEQISEHLTITPGAVAQALHKARAKLESILVGASKGE